MPRSLVTGARYHGIGTQFPEEFEVGRGEAHMEERDEDAAAINDQLQQQHATNNKHQTQFAPTTSVLPPQHPHASTTTIHLPNVNNTFEIALGEGLAVVAVTQDMFVAMRNGARRRDRRHGS